MLARLSVRPSTGAAMKLAIAYVPCRLCLLEHLMLGHGQARNTAFLQLLQLPAVGSLRSGIRSSNTPLRKGAHWKGSKCSALGCVGTVR